MQNSCHLFETIVCTVLPCRERLQLVVGQMQDPQVWVTHQHRHTLIRQEIVGQIQQLQCAQTLLPNIGRWQRLQTISRSVQIPEADTHTGRAPPSIVSLAFSEDTLALSLSMEHDYPCSQIPTVTSFRVFSHCFCPIEAPFTQGGWVYSWILQKPDSHLLLSFIIWKPQKCVGEFDLHKYLNCDHIFSEKCWSQCYRVVVSSDYFQLFAILHNFFLFFSLFYFFVLFLGYIW